MKFWPTVIFLLLLPTTHVKGNDKIRSLVGVLRNWPYAEPWDNGNFSPINLPEKASPERLVSEALYSCGLLGTHWPTVVHRYKVVATEKVVIPSSFPGRSKYTVVLIRTDRGEKIVMMRRDGDSWWTRVYNVEAHGKPYEFSIPGPEA